MGSAGSVIDDIVLCPAEFIDAWAAHERDAARLALAARRLEVCGSWADDGSVSMAAWLRNQCRMSHRDATGLVHRGRFLDKFAGSARAACDGVLSAGQVAALRAVTKPAVEEVLAVQQSELIGIVAPLTVADAEQAVGLWRQRAEALVELPEPVEADRELRMGRTADGLVGKFVLDEMGAVQFQRRSVLHQPGTARATPAKLRGVQRMLWSIFVRSSTPTTPGRAHPADAPTSKCRSKLTAWLGYRWRGPPITPGSVAPRSMCCCVIV